MPRKNDGKHKCLTCRYRFQASGEVEVYCQYIVIEGHRRPCAGGEMCTVYVKGRVHKKS